MNVEMDWPARIGELWALRYTGWVGSDNYYVIRPFGITLAKLGLI